MFVFGSGVLTGTQLNVANPTPINFGLVQKVSVEHVGQRQGTLRPIRVPGRRRLRHAQSAVQGVVGALQRASHRSPVLQPSADFRLDVSVLDDISVRGGA